MTDNVIEAKEPDDLAEARKAVGSGWQDLEYALTAEMSALFFAAAQAHATIALVEQQRRTADALEQILHLLNNGTALA